MLVYYIIGPIQFTDVDYKDKKSVKTYLHVIWKQLKRVQYFTRSYSYQQQSKPSTQRLKFELEPLFNIAWKDEYLFSYINTLLGLFQCPIYNSIYGNADTGFNFGNQKAAVIQWLNTSTTILIETKQQHKDNQRATNVKANPLHVRHLLR